MKNALYSIRSAKKGKIYLSLDTEVITNEFELGQKANVIYFRDTGAGIEQETLEKIFDSFFTTKEGGTGAGLAYCKRTIESFKGKIECDSVVGEYCQFRIVLPEVKIFS